MPKLDEILDDSDEEPEPDAVMEIPLKKVKLVVGPGGEKIRLIEKKSKARLQVCLPLNSACCALRGALLRSCQKHRQDNVFT